MTELRSLNSSINTLRQEIDAGSKRLWKVDDGVKFCVQQLRDMQSRLGVRTALRNPERNYRIDWNERQMMTDKTANDASRRTSRSASKSRSRSRSPSKKMSIGKVVPLKVYSKP